MLFESLGGKEENSHIKKKNHWLQIVLTSVPFINKELFLGEGLNSIHIF